MTTSDNQLAVPTVHRNGTSGKELLEQMMDARSAVHDAIKAVQNTCPNGRDYYVQGNNATQEAIRQHTARLVALEKVYRELGEIAEAIVDQDT